ncbi:MAG: RNA polymerase sigma factor [Solirubrobacterales bacterium]
MTAAPEMDSRRTSSRRAPLDVESLYRATRDDVYAYVTSMVGVGAAADDVTSAVFERAFRRRARFDPRRGEPRAWIFTIARNTALDELRRRERHADPHADPPVAAEDPGRELHLQVRDALAALDPRQRELIVLKFHAGLTQAEIGAVLGISPTAAGTRLHRALATLRRICDV